jgi:hypothetical protein
MVERVEKIVDPLCRRVRVQATAQGGILCRHADGAAAGVTVIAVTRFDPDFRLVVGLWDILVAVQGHHRRVTDRDSVCPQREGLGNVAAITDAARVDERDLAPLAEVIDRAPGLTYRGHAGHTSVFRRQMRAGTGAAFHAVHVDAVGIAFHGHPHIVVDPCRAELQLDRDLPIRNLADLLNLERQIVRAQPIRMTGGRALVDARR